MFVSEWESLPWIDQAKHLGNTITNIQDGLSQDLRYKRAQYIERNMEIIQEFSFHTLKSNVGLIESTIARFLGHYCMTWHLRRLAN